MNPVGLLIVGHGTRDAEGRAEFLALADAVGRQFPEKLVEPCFLELAEPTIDQALERLVERGVRERLTVAPLLLFAAGHAKNDIPEAVAQAAEKYAALRTRQIAHLGCTAALVELSRRRYLESLRDRPQIAESQTLLVVVGRGSRDPSANSEMAQFARLRWEAQPVGWLETCYTAMTEPSLERTLEMAARLPFGRIVVQPHLLFRGELLARIERTTAEFAHRHPRAEWFSTAHLGPDSLVVEAVVAAVHAAEAEA